VGEVGSEITLDITKEINFDYLLLNTKKNTKYITKNITIDTYSWINPSIHKIRESFINQLDKILPFIDKYTNIIIIGNLASKFGIAIIPILTNILHKNKEKEIFSFVIMPFGFEKNKIFQSGVSLSFTTKFSNTTVVVDNNSFFKNNPELSIPECYKITNNAVKDIIILYCKRGFPTELNMLATCKESEKIEYAFIDSMSMLNDINVKTIEKTFIIIYPAKEKMDKLDNIINTIEKFTDNVESDVNVITDQNNNNFSKMHLVSKTNNLIFSMYDPLNKIIPKDKVLDYEPEINCNIKGIHYLKDIESNIVN
jgi:cell division protein FtsZ